LRFEIFGCCRAFGNVRIPQLNFFRRDDFKNSEHGEISGIGREQPAHTCGVRHLAKDDPATAVCIGNELVDRVEILENFPLPGARKLVSRTFFIFYRP